MHLYKQLLIVIYADTISKEDDDYLYKTFVELSKEYACIWPTLYNPSEGFTTEEPADYIVTFTRVDGKLTHEIKPYESKTTQKSEGTV